MKVFVSATGTGVGKTWLTAGLARALETRGRRVAALKPIETGCTPDPLDALELAHAAHRPELAHARGFHRGERPLAPWAATLEGDAPPPALPDLVAAIDAAAADSDDLIVEGAGGILVPYDESHDLADLVAALDLPLVLVAPNRLGTLSHVFTAVESIGHRGLPLAAVALTSPNADDDLSARTNATVLRARLRCPVVVFRHAPSPHVGALEELLHAIEASYHS